MTLKWTTRKPKLDKECLLITACNYGDTSWAYSIFTIEKAEYDGKWYWALLTGDGDEWGDISDLTADKYCVLPLLKNKKQKL